MRSHEIENWALQVIDRIESGQPNDSVAELPHTGPVKQGRGKIALDTRAVMAVRGISN